MAILKVRLFGGLEIQNEKNAAIPISAGKVHELLCYLLLFKRQVHQRDTLLNVLWADHTLARAKKALRQTLWQLKTDLVDVADLLEVDSNIVRIAPNADIWLDVTEFERACDEIRIDSHDWPEACVQRLQRASQLYRTGLLPGCHSEWCIRESERLDKLYVRLLDTLAECSETQADFDGIQHYARQLLRQDPAHERSHQRLMRMYYLAGDRTAALRQYQQCVRALSDELNVMPGNKTQELYAHICADDVPTADATARRKTMDDLRMEVRQLKSMLKDLQQQIIDAAKLDGY